MCRAPQAVSGPFKVLDLENKVVVIRSVVVGEGEYLPGFYFVLNYDCSHFRCTLIRLEERGVFGEGLHEGKKRWQTIPEERNDPTAETDICQGRLCVVDDAVPVLGVEDADEEQWLLPKTNAGTKLKAPSLITKNQHKMEQQDLRSRQETRKLACPVQPNRELIPLCPVSEGFKVIHGGRSWDVTSVTFRAGGEFGGALMASWNV
jgi:hypothetical protein